jgi:3-hydroxybutyryl-CoA dehydrogenase
MRVAIFGAGLMGHALAVVFALGGHRVRLTDNNPATLAAAPLQMAAIVATLREAGTIGPEWTEERMTASVTLSTDVHETVADAELVIEAIVEKAEAKRALFAAVDAHAPVDAIIASNTSRLDIFPLVPERRQTHTLIAHWYAPPYIVDLCDIVGSEKTDRAVIETVRATVAAMGKAPVVMRRFIPGYICNRIQAAISLEVNRLLDEGYASPRDIDDAIIYGLALRMPILGHLAKADFSGIALAQAALANGTYDPPPKRLSSQTLDNLVATGRTGVSAGAGYFDWHGRTPQEWTQERDRRLLALKAALAGIGPLRGDN